MPNSFQFQTGDKSRLKKERETLYHKKEGRKRAEKKRRGEEGNGNRYYANPRDIENKRTPEPSPNTHFSSSSSPLSRPGKLEPLEERLKRSKFPGFATVSAYSILPPLNYPPSLLSLSPSPLQKRSSSSSLVHPSRN